MALKRRSPPASSTFHTQNRASGSHSQLVVNAAEVTLPMFWWTKCPVDQERQDGRGQEDHEPAAALARQELSQPGHDQ